jgi:hypothetical protein
MIILATEIKKISRASCFSVPFKEASSSDSIIRNTTAIPYNYQQDIIKILLILEFYTLCAMCYSTTFIYFQLIDLILIKERQHNENR